MLCTPPAFILSQDQTLEIIISYLGLPSYNLFELFFLSFSYFVEYINSWVSKNSSLTRLVFRTYNLLCTYLLLFNFQWPLLSLFRDSLVIIPHSFPFVNTFFKLFSKFFSGFWQGFVVPLLRVFRRSERLWWAIRDSNPGPTGYEPVALTNWANGPNLLQLDYYTIFNSFVNIFLQQSNKFLDFTL